MDSEDCGEMCMKQNCGINEEKITYTYLSTIQILVSVQSLRVLTTGDLVQIVSSLIGFGRPELSGCITTLTICNTGGCKLLCSNGHLGRSR